MTTKPTKPRWPETLTQPVVNITSCSPITERPNKSSAYRTTRIIIETVCEHYGLHVEALMSKNTVRRVATPRQLVMYLCRELTDRSWEAIAFSFGKDHGTAMYAHEVTKNRIETQPMFARDHQQIRDAIHEKISKANLVLPTRRAA